MNNGQNNVVTESRFDKLFRGVRITMNLVGILGLAFVVMDPSFGEMPWYCFLKALLAPPVYAVFLLHLSLAIILSRSIWGFLKNHSLDAVFFIPLFSMSFGGVHPAHILMVRQFVHYFYRYLQSSTLTNLADSITERPARVIAVSFLGIILIGAFLLVLPVSVSPAFKPSFLTALFTSTSAVCVTGLNVIDPGTYFTQFGQIIVLGLIQVGGLGIMTLSAGVILLAGRRMGISQISVMQNVLDQSDLAGLRRILVDIIRWTFLIEGIGALILSQRFWAVSKCSPLRAIYLGVFHSVSAFCNAGFALFPNNLMDFAGDPAVNFTVMGLIVFGGLGFSVIGFLAGFFAKGRRRRPVDVHSTLVLTATIFLIIVGAGTIFVLEYQGPAMEHLSLSEKVMASFFASVTPRTAGFNTIDTGLMKTSTLFFTVILMFIGASPGSTGGGIKTTTMATMILALDSQMKGASDVVVMERTIPNDVVLRAFLITAISAVLVGVYTFLLILLEDQPLIKILFEVTSAFGTVGLSANLTPSLCSLSQLLIISLMYIGRIGPLTLALTIRKASDKGNIHYPTTRVIVG